MLQKIKAISMSTKININKRIIETLALEFDISSLKKIQCLVPFMFLLSPQTCSRRPLEHPGTNKQ